MQWPNAFEAAIRAQFPAGDALLAALDGVSPLGREGFLERLGEPGPGRLAGQYRGL